jgi:hypothetical protein
MVHQDHRCPVAGVGFIDLNLLAALNALLRPPLTLIDIEPPESPLARLTAHIQSYLTVTDVSREIERILLAGLRQHVCLVAFTTGEQVDTRFHARGEDVDCPIQHPRASDTGLRR